jgi:cell division protein FtsN
VSCERGAAASATRGVAAALLSVALFGALIDTTPLHAQAATPPAAQAPSLEEVESLMNAGRTEDARTVLTAWMGATAPRAGSPRPAERAAPRAPSRAEAQRALWLRALLTVDPVQAAVDYQRLVVEYPGGPFSDRALLRLAQAAEAQGEAARAHDLLASLLRDYPGSPLRLDAGRMLESLPSEDVLRAAPQERPGATPAAPAEPPQTAERRPSGAAPQTAETRPSAAAAAPEVAPLPAVAPPVRSAGPTPRWTVQLGAFASAERAAGLRDELTAEGIDVRLVSVAGTRLIHVRTGRFATQTEAERVRDRLTGRGLDATVAGDADREEAAR